METTLKLFSTAQRQPRDNLDTTLGQLSDNFETIRKTRTTRTILENFEKTVRQYYDRMVTSKFYALIPVFSFVSINSKDWPWSKSQED